jgi:hypothetical protein
VAANWESCFIPDDGYTEPGFIQAIPGLHGDLRFTYRPMLVEVNAEVGEAFKSLSSADCERKAAAVLADHLKTWDVVHPKTKAPVPVTPANLLRMKSAVFSRLWGIVRGLDPTDIDPKWTAEQKQQATETKFESALTGDTPGMVREVADEKNSDPG